MPHIADLDADQIRGLETIYNGIGQASALDPEGTAQMRATARALLAVLGWEVRWSETQHRYRLMVPPYRAPGSDADARHDDHDNQSAEREDNA